MCYTCRNAQVLLLLALLCVALGCGSGRVPVLGKVVYPDQSPVPAGTVIGQTTIDGKPVSVQANIEADGSFKLGTTLPGDGALPGRYQFIVMPVALGDAELAAGKTPDVDSKYSDFDSAAIFFDVMKDQKNEFTISVTKPKGGR